MDDPDEGKPKTSEEQRKENVAAREKEILAETGQTTFTHRQREDARAKAEEEFDPVKIARRRQLQDVVKSEGEAGLDKRLTHMRSQMEIEGTNKEMLASLIKSYEEKKAELEAARANGG